MADMQATTTQQTTREGEAARTADAALTAMVVDHYDRLLGLARLICRDPTDAADAVQVGFERAWRARKTLSDVDRIRPWLDRIVAREAVRIAQQRRSIWRRVVTGEPGVTWTGPVDHSSELGASMEALREAFRSLPPDQRAVVGLHLHLGYSVEETATIVGAPVETVRTRLRRAKDRLRRSMAEETR